MQRAQVHVGDRSVEFFIRPLERVPEHLAEAGCVRPHLRRAVALRNTIAHFLKTLHHQTAGKVDVHVVGEEDRDIGQAKQADRTDFLDLWQTGQARFDRKGEQFLDVLGRKPG